MDMTNPGVSRSLAVPSQDSSGGALYFHRGIHRFKDLGAVRNVHGADEVLLAHFDGLSPNFKTKLAAATLGHQLLPARDLKADPNAAKELTRHEFRVRMEKTERHRRGMPPARFRRFTPT